MGKRIHLLLDIDCSDVDHLKEAIDLAIEGIFERNFRGSSGGQREAESDTDWWSEYHISAEDKADPV